MNECFNVTLVVLEMMQVVDQIKLFSARLQMETSHQNVSNRRTSAYQPYSV